MDPEIIIPLSGMLTGVIVVSGISWAIVRVSQGPVGQALARKLSGRGAEPDHDLVHEVLELRHQLEQLHQRVSETEERVDFSERLLARRSETAVERPSG